MALTVAAAVCRFRSGGNMSSLPVMALAPCAVSLPMSSPAVTARNEGKYADKKRAPDGRSFPYNATRAAHPGGPRPLEKEVISPDPLRAIYPL